MCNNWPLTPLCGIDVTSLCKVGYVNAVICFCVWHLLWWLGQGIVYNLTIRYVSRYTLLLNNISSFIKTKLSYNICCLDMSAVAQLGLQWCYNRQRRGVATFSGFRALASSSAQARSASVKVHNSLAFFRTSVESNAAALRSAPTFRRLCSISYLHLSWACARGY